MNPGLMFSAAALALASLPLAAQQANARVSQSAATPTSGVSASQSANAGAQAGPASAQANGSASATAQMRPVNTELVGRLDSKSAKAGDPVIVKTTEKVRTADGVLIPRGSWLVGRVAAVQAQGSGQADSNLTLVFDHAELKGGQSISIRSVIESVAPPARAMASGSLESEDSLAMAEPMGATRGGGRLGGGLVGGTLGTAGSMAGGATSNFAATSGNTASSLGAATGSAVHSTAGLAGEATAGVGSGASGAAGAGGAFAAHTTGIPGLMLAGDASGSASGTLSASRKNVHLDSGTQMVLGLSGGLAR